MVRLRLLIRKAAAAVVLALLAGCIPAGTLRTGTPLEDEKVGFLKPGTTTKRELFERLGAPAAIVGRGEVAVVRTPWLWSNIPSNTQEYAFDADTLFELFPADGQDQGYERIYYYRRIESRKMGYFFIFGAYESATTRVDELWLLMDEKAGVAKDYAFRKSGAGVVYGVPRNGARQ